MKNNDKRLIEIFQKVNNVKINLFEEEKKNDDTVDAKIKDVDIESDHDVERLIQQKDDVGDVVKGGLGKKSTSSEFDFEQLKKGLKVELEHTDDPLVALDIAFDHLKEDSKYYGENDDDPEEMAMKNARKDVEKEEDN